MKHRTYSYMQHKYRRCDPCYPGVISKIISGNMEEVFDILLNSKEDAINEENYTQLSTG